VSLEKSPTFHGYKVNAFISFQISYKICFVFRHPIGLCQISATNLR